VTLRDQRRGEIFDGRQTGILSASGPCIFAHRANFIHSHHDNISNVVIENIQPRSKGFDDNRKKSPNEVEDNPKKNEIENKSHSHLKIKNFLSFSIRKNVLYDKPRFFDMCLLPHMQNV